MRTPWRNCHPILGASCLSAQRSAVQGPGLTCCMLIHQDKRVATQNKDKLGVHLAQRMRLLQLLSAEPRGLELGQHRPLH